MPKAAPNLYQNATYRAFVQKRDQVLEKLLRNTQKEITDYTNIAFSDIQNQCIRIAMANNGAENARFAVQSFEREVDRVLSDLAKRISYARERLMRLTHIFTVVSEAEAIARVKMGGKYNANIQRKKVDLSRIVYSLNKLKYKLLRSFEFGMISEEDPNEVQSRIISDFPKIQAYKRPPKVLKKVKEADAQPKKPKVDASIGFVTDQEWDEIVTAYKSDYIPRFRGPKSVYDIKSGKGEDLEEWYGWEIEKELNQDFIQQVRDGQIDAANQNGFTDMVWIAIIDDRTDECCLWRNGLTTKEIESRLEEMGGVDDEGCDAVVPAAHFNCRCTLAPYSEDIETIPHPDFKDFDAWLNE